MNLYEPAGEWIASVSVIGIEDLQHRCGQRYVEMVSNHGFKGYAGPLDGEYQFNALMSILPQLREKLLHCDVCDESLNFRNLWDRLFPGHPLEAYEDGKDPLTGSRVWQTHRTARHTATGEIITALSAVDIALWDLRGKVRQQPVYRLLGGTRDRLPVYVSCMMNKTPEQALSAAAGWYAKGFTRHKCFLPHHPSEPDGIRANMEMAETLYRELPADAEIMFDLSRLGDECDDPSTRPERLRWACAMVKELGGHHPVWAEEPVSPDDIEGYAAVRAANPSVVISGGEHIYTRYNLRPYLERGLLDVVQCDPEWCGGISELMEIIQMVRTSYPNVRIMPHGHMFLAAPHCVAAQPESVTPLTEYLYQVIPDRTRYMTAQVEPEEGFFTMPAGAGLGVDLDPKKYQETERYSF